RIGYATFTVGLASTLVLGAVAQEKTEDEKPSRTVTEALQSEQLEKLKTQRLQLRDPQVLREGQQVPQMRQLERPQLQRLQRTEQSEQKLEEEGVDERRLRLTEDRFRTNVKVALEWLEENSEQAAGQFLREDIEQIRKAMESETLDEYMSEQEQIFRKMAEEGPTLQPTIYLVSDFGSMVRAARDTDAELQRLSGFTRETYGAEVHKAYLEQFGQIRRLNPEVYQAIQKFWITWTPIEPEPEPVDDTSEMDCTLELGYHSTNSEGATACLPPGVTVANGSSRNFSANGLFATQDIPLEPHLTCTKNQARRGTCVGFAITANLETRASVKRDKKYNFSEQYNYFKSEIYTGNNRYSYGLSTHDTVKDWADDDWETGRETTWRYNPSWSIKDIDTGSIWTATDNVYPDSCDGYTPHCTDYAFQGTPNSSHSVFTRPSPQTGTDSLGAIQNYRYNWGLFYRSREDALMDSVVPLLERRIPVIVSYTVTDNYMGLGSSDYLVWSASDGQRTGGHATLIVGYVDKDDIPAGAPTPVGNGYFIIKNSWGANRADCGYEYVDERWLREQMKGLSSLSVG
ncbi:MAG: C1 family peptidase, partial [Pseudomonadota bacterium]